MSDTQQLTNAMYNVVKANEQVQFEVQDVKRILDDILQELRAIRSDLANG